MNTTAELLEAVDASAEVRAHYVGSSQSELVRGLVASQDYDLAVRVSSVLLGELETLRQAHRAIGPPRNGTTEEIDVLYRLLGRWLSSEATDDEKEKLRRLALVAAEKLAYDGPVPILAAAIAMTGSLAGEESAEPVFAEKQVASDLGAKSVLLTALVDEDATALIHLCEAALTAAGTHR